MDTKTTQRKVVRAYLKKLSLAFLLTMTFNSYSQTNDKLILQNYPNPFNSSTTIYYTISTASPVELTVFNLLGSRIEVIEAADKAPGSYSLDWNVKNLHEGIYLLQLRTNDQVITKKIVLNK